MEVTGTKAKILHEITKGVNTHSHRRGPRTEPWGTSSFRSQLAEEEPAKEPEKEWAVRKNVKEVWSPGSQVKKLFKRGRRDWLY